MRYLLHIVLFIGVALIGFQNSYASLDDEKDKKTISTDKDHESEGSKKDTILKVDDVEVDDTLVFDDYDEDDVGIIATKVPSIYPIIGCGYTMAIPKDSPSSFDDNKTELSTSDGSQLESPSDVILALTELNIFPNPANQSSGKINLRHNAEGNVDVYVTDQSGRTISTLVSNSETITFDTRAAGVYLVTVTSGTTKITSRLLVQ